MLDERRTVRGYALLVGALFIAWGCKAPHPRANAPAAIEAESEAQVTETSVGVPKQLFSFDDQRAGDLAFQPNSRRFFAAYGSTVTVFDPHPADVFDDARFRKHLIVGDDGTLFLDGVRRPATIAPLPPRASEDGYEVTEAIHTADGQFVAASISWRPPRGRPVRGPDGDTTYKYGRPNQAPGASDYFRVIGTADQAEILRLDGRFSNFASSQTRFAVALAAVGPSIATVLVEPATASHRVLERDVDGPAPPGIPAFSPAGDMLVVGAFEGTLTTWVAPDFRLLKTVRVAPGGARITAIAVHPGGAVFVGFDDGRMAFANPADGALLHEWSVPEHAELENFARSVSAAAISEDGTRLVTAHAAVGSNVRVWSLQP